MPDTQQDLFAAIDLGSNSFHMVIAKAIGGELQMIDRIKESVRLASGLLPNGDLDKASKIRALDCLERFGQRLRQFNPKNVRAVGTNTLRAAQKSRAFRKKAEKALGFPIDIIGGHEEARLIHVGVSHSLAYKSGRRLVVDIGGGSTECIIGEGYECVQADSLYMGCVSFTNRFFEDGVITAERMEEAKIAAELELHPVERGYRKLGWREAVGASGTIKAIAKILEETGWSSGGITGEGLDQLWDACIEAGHVENLKLQGLQSERALVLPGGLAILKGIFEILRIKKMNASPGALREGILHELFGRVQHDDPREMSVRRLCERYQVDTQQCAMVEDTALSLLSQAPKVWGLHRPIAESMLSWSARLHEVGLALSYSGYHKHSAYLILNSDIPGFSKQELSALAAIIGSHRRKIRMSLIEEALVESQASLKRLVALFRLAVMLNRGRSRNHVPEVAFSVRGARWRLDFDEGWLEDHPLTRADMVTEQGYLKALDIDLVW